MMYKNIVTPARQQYSHRHAVLADAFSSLKPALETKVSATRTWNLQLCSNPT